VKKVDVFGLQISQVNIDGIVELALANSEFKYVVTPNIQHLTGLDIDPEKRLFYTSADLTICDSRIFCLIANILRKRIEYVTPGSDLTNHLFNDVFNGDESIMIVGANQNQISYIRDKYGMTNLTHYCPPMGFVDCPYEVKKAIRAVLDIKPRFLFLALGFPRQEQLAYQLKMRANFQCTAFCIGASIDFITGKSRRAPLLMQKLYLEWLYRFLQEPKRLFRRYFIDTWRLIPLIYNEYMK